MKASFLNIGLLVVIFSSTVYGNQYEKICVGCVYFPFPSPKFKMSFDIKQQSYFNVAGSCIGKLKRLKIL